MLGPRSRRWFRIERQLWSDNPLIRSHPLMEQDTGNKQRDWLLKVASQPSSRFLIWHRGKFAVTQSTSNIPSTKSSSTKSSSIQLTWQNYTFVERLKQSCNITPYEFDPKPIHIDTTLLLLGRTKDIKDLAKVNVMDPTLVVPNEWRFAIDLSSMEEEDLLRLLETDTDTDTTNGTATTTKSSTSGSAKLVSPRSLMSTLTHDPGAMAVAGITSARMNWHNEVKYCRKSGNRTVPTGAGHRRLDPEEDNHRNAISYPRTDPVAIMLVQNIKGDHCLLGRTARRANTNMYTCLAGFIEQAESVEDAVRREVEEESGVIISNYEDVRLVGSQPWPIGAAGHSELMLGCIATASNETITVNKDEMDDVRWFSKDEVKLLLQRSTEKNASGDANKALIVPPPYAIAHHLIKTWVETEQMEEPIVANHPKDWNWNVIASSTLIGAMIGAVLTKASF